MEKELFIKHLRSGNDLNEDTLSGFKDLTQNYPWFQAGWMVYLMNLKKINHPDFEATLKKVAILVPDRKRLYKFLNNELKFAGDSSIRSSTFYNYQIEGRPAPKSDSLIDKFLSSNPGAIRNTRVENNEDNTTDNKHIIEKSVIENDDLITETLANLYVQQKNYEKALDAFQKLSLKYPEKSIYFASRIKEIEVIKHNI